MFYFALLTIWNIIVGCGGNLAALCRFLSRKLDVALVCHFSSHSALAAVVGLYLPVVDEAALGADVQVDGHVVGGVVGTGGDAGVGLTC